MCLSVCLSVCVCVCALRASFCHHREVSFFLSLFVTPVETLFACVWSVLVYVLDGDGLACWSCVIIELQIEKDFL